jgi:L-ascorbate metabolism protein UlaG (beta-lactamase superfamily)
MAPLASRRESMGMNLLHLRSATALLTLGEHHLLVDPMLSEASTMPSFRMTGERRRNPLVALPPATKAALGRATAALVTHEHPDHLDRAGKEFLRERRLPVWTNGIDAPSLQQKGLDAHVLVDGALGMRVETVRSKHGRGVFGWVLGPVCGYYLAHPAEPSVYVVGDSILTDSVLEAIERLRPDVVVAPAGAANMGVGGDILFSVDELITLVRVAPGEVVLNHLEALDHCPTKRSELRARMSAEGFAHRVHVPEDGEELTFTRSTPTSAVAPRIANPERPGVQKWLTSRLLAGK